MYQGQIDWFPGKMTDRQPSLKAVMRKLRDQMGKLAEGDGVVYVMEYEDYGPGGPTIEGKLIVREVGKEFEVAGRIFHLDYILRIDVPTRLICMMNRWDLAEIATFQFEVA